MVNEEQEPERILMGNEELDGAMLNALNLGKPSLRLLTFMFTVPEGTFISSVEITGVLKLPQSRISAAARPLKLHGWITSGKKGFCRTMSEENIKKDMVAKYQQTLSKIK